MKCAGLLIELKFSPNFPIRVKTLEREREQVRRRGKKIRKINRNIFPKLRKSKQKQLKKVKIDEQQNGCSEMQMVKLTFLPNNFYQKCK